jgi:pyruvate dehydrogenase E1 component alpha subunit
MTQTVPDTLPDLPDLPDTEGTAIRLLEPDGTLRATSFLGLEVTPELCRSLYRDMALARRFDLEAVALQRQGELGLWLQSLGQEAAQVGSIRALRRDDHVFPSYREHAAALCRGITPSELLAQWRGAAHGAWDPMKYRFHIYSLVLATQTLHATGYALGVLADSADEVVLAYLGDGASSQGDANEAFNWAVVTGAPVLFFCQNNQWAISTPASKQTGRALHERAAGFGLDSYLVDGNDVLAVHAVTRTAVARVRAGKGPAFVEAITYRMAGHSTSDDPRRYRTAEESASWEARDPLIRLRTLLERRDWADDAFFAGLAQDGDRLATATRRSCHEMVSVPLDTVFRTTLARETPLLAAERRAAAAFRESLA